MFKSNQKIILSIVSAFVLWTFMFSPWTKTILPFWYAMTASAVILLLLAWPHVKSLLHFSWIDILLGIGIAVLLWGVFWVGDKVSQWIFPSFARPEVDAIYAMKEGMQPWLISLLLLFVIGPTEEIFWRGYVQTALCRIIKQPLWGAALSVGIYALVHFFSLNFMLIMAALVCGVIWGGLYYFLPQRLGALIISHALWDAAVFIWFPIL